MMKGEFCKTLDKEVELMRLVLLLYCETMTQILIIWREQR